MIAICRSESCVEIVMPAYHVTSGQLRHLKRRLTEIRSLFADHFRRDCVPRTRRKFCWGLQFMPIPPITCFHHVS